MKDLVWKNIMFFVYLHIGSFYGIYLILTGQCTIATILMSKFNIFKTTDLCYWWIAVRTKCVNFCLLSFQLSSCSSHSLGFIGYYCWCTSFMVSQSIQSKMAIEINFNILQHDSTSEWNMGLGTWSQVSHFINSSVLLCYYFAFCTYHKFSLNSCKVLLFFSRFLFVSGIFV